MKSLLLTAGIDWAAFGTVLILMLGVAAVFGTLILLTEKFFKVEQDDKINLILNLLPKANCGGCGHPGCESFAKALIDGKAGLDDCKSAKKESKIEIAGILGQTSEVAEETVAVVACRGGDNCKDKFSYQGYADCMSQAALNDGRKACPSGCIGAGSCVKACPSGAMELCGGFARVDKRHCSSCGLCMAACPKNLIKRIPKNAKVFVACSCPGKGKEAIQACGKSCTACALCEKNCPSGAIQLVNNIPVIDYSKCSNCKICVAKCPRKVITEIE